MLTLNRIFALRRIPCRGLWLSVLCAMSLCYLGSGARAQTDTYPPPPPGTPFGKPSLSFVPRPKDPPGPVIGDAELDVTVPNAFSIEPYFGQGVIGPDFSAAGDFGLTFTNATDSLRRIRAFRLVFTAPYADIAIDTFYRTDDLQGFDPPTPTPTWDFFTAVRQVEGSRYHWDILFVESPDYLWESIFVDGEKRPFITLLGSQFAPDDEITFTYTPYSEIPRLPFEAPEPGAVALALTLLAGGAAWKARSRRA